MIIKYPKDVISVVDATPSVLHTEVAGWLDLDATSQSIGVISWVMSSDILQLNWINDTPYMEGTGY